MDGVLVGIGLLWPSSMFGLVQVKTFGFIQKWPTQLHPQLVHWWVLGHN
jgi:hypothetical protein